MKYLALWLDIDVLPHGGRWGQLVWTHAWLDLDINCTGWRGMIQIYQDSVTEYDACSSWVCTLWISHHSSTGRFVLDTGWADVGSRSLEILQGPRSQTRTQRCSQPLMTLSHTLLGYCGPNWWCSGHRHATFSCLPFCDLVMGGLIFCIIIKCIWLDWLVVLRWLAGWARPCGPVDNAMELRIFYGYQVSKTFAHSEQWP